MTPQYRVKYEETKETIFQTCELYRLDSSVTGFRIGASALAIMILIFVAPNMGVLSYPPEKLLLFLLKYWGIWVLIFIALEIFRKTFGKKLISTAAYGDADAAYERRKEKQLENLPVEIDFYNDHFVNSTQSQQTEYSYQQVVKLLESKTAIGLVVRKQSGAKGLFGFPKEALEDASLTMFKAFLEKSCPNVKKGFYKF